MKITASRVKELIKEEIEKFLLEEKFDFSGQSYKSVAKATRSALRKKGIKGGSVLSGLKKLSYNDPLRKAYRKWYSDRGKTPTVTDPKTKKRAKVEKVPTPRATTAAQRAAAKKKKDAAKKKGDKRIAGYKADKAAAEKPQNLGTGVAKKPRKVEKVPTPRATTAAQRAAAKKKKDADKEKSDARIAKFKADKAAAEKAAAANKKKDDKAVTNLESLQKKIEALVREALK